MFNLNYVNTRLTDFPIESAFFKILGSSALKLISIFVSVFKHSLKTEISFIIKRLVSIFVYRLEASEHQEL